MASLADLKESNATNDSDTVNATLSTTATAIIAASGTSPYLCAVVDFVFLTLIQMFLVFFGLVGNTLSMIVFWTMTPQTPTSLLLIWLSVFDNVVLVFYFLLTGIGPICKLYQVSDNPSPGP